MKRTILFVIAVCLFHGSILNAYAQTRKRQPRTQQKPPAEVNKPSSSKVSLAEQPPIRLLFTSQRRADAIRAADRLKKLGANVILSETSDGGISEHIGKIYYLPGDESSAKKIAQAISDIEKVIPTVKENNPDAQHFSLWIVGDPPTQSKKTVSQPQKPQEEWQISYTKFIQELVRYSITHTEERISELYKPEGGNEEYVRVIGLAEGIVVDQSINVIKNGKLVNLPINVMKTYGGKPIKWEGVFRSLGESPSTHKSQPAKINIELDKAEAVVLAFIYSRSPAADKWNQIQPGTRVSFRGEIVGILFDFFPFRGEQRMVHIVTVYNAEFLEEIKRQ